MYEGIDRRKKQHLTIHSRRATDATTTSSDDSGDMLTSIATGMVIGEALGMFGSSDSTPSFDTGSSSSSDFGGFGGGDSGGGGASSTW